jgi:hypothetical protein
LISLEQFANVLLAKEGEKYLEEMLKVSSQFDVENKRHILRCISNLVWNGKTYPGLYSNVGLSFSQIRLLNA